MDEDWIFQTLHETAPDASKQAAPANNTANTEQPPQRFNTAQKTAFTREPKIKVRPRVFLTRSELAELKKDFSDAEISVMLDMLSDYKCANPQRYYSSDLQPLLGWCAKSVRSPKQSQSDEQTPQTRDNLPDWIFN